MIFVDSPLNVGFSYSEVCSQPAPSLAPHSMHYHNALCVPSCFTAKQDK